MKQITHSVFLFFLGLFWLQPVYGETVKIVTSLSSYADIAKSIGGERVEVASIVSAKFNPHFIEPRPSDVLRLKKADLFIHSGLDLEAWRSPLLDAVAKSELREGGARQLDLSEGVQLLEVPGGQVSRSEGDIHIFGNPHYRQNPQNGLIIGHQIAAKLKAIDPEGAAAYEGGWKTFEAALREKIAEWEKVMRTFKGQEILGYHNEWIYLMSFLGLTMTKFVEPKPGVPPGPQHLEHLVLYIRSSKIKALAQATFYPTEGGDYLHEKTGIAVLALCQNVGELPECGSYIAMIDHSVKKIEEGLRR